jgi:hypothetical protein
MLFVVYDTLQFSHQITDLPKQVLHQVESPFYWGYKMYAYF